jgi:hypothetical protein
LKHDRPVACTGEARFENDVDGAAVACLVDMTGCLLMAASRADVLKVESRRALGEDGFARYRARAVKGKDERGLVSGSGRGGLAEVDGWTERFFEELVGAGRDGIEIPSEIGSDGIWVRAGRHSGEGVGSRGLYALEQLAAAPVGEGGQEVQVSRVVRCNGDDLGAEIFHICDDGFAPAVAGLGFSQDPGVVGIGDLDLLAEDAAGKIIRMNPW